MAFIIRVWTNTQQKAFRLDRRTALGRSLSKILCGLFLLIPLLFAAPKKAEAFCVCCCTPIADAMMQSVMQAILTQSIITNLHIVMEFQLHQLWLTTIYYRAYWGPAIAMMTEQMSAISLYQMQIIGAFIDAKHQIETQRLFSELGAQAMKDYTPSDALCSIGSAGRSLGQSDFNAKLTSTLMEQRSRDRQLLNANTNAAEGPKEDREGRVDQFLNKYCDVNDDANALGVVCAAAVTQARRNKDVDYGYTIGQPWTLNINFSDNTVTDDEEDVLALGSNLYAHNIFDVVNPALLDNNPANQQLYLDLRAIVAKRSVAEQSYDAITGMKSSGASNAAQTATYLREIMRQLGIATDAEIDAIIGTNPSYYAQMEILTKKLFQTPDFLIDLYEKPANTARKGVALEALNLIQENDIYNSALRSEQMMSTLLELKLEREQSIVQNKVKDMTR